MLPSILIGGQKIATSRYHHRQGINGGEAMRIFLTGPREVLTVEGRDEVIAAVREINLATAPDEQPGHWIGAQED